MLERLFLIRHAPVIGKSGLIYGDDADIDLDGQKPRINELADILPSPKQSVWFSSGVDRAVRTAQAVLFSMKAPATEVRPHIKFREQNFGSLLGQRYEDITEHLTFVDGKIYAPNPPQGESIPKFIKRVGEGVADIRNSFSEQSSAVVFCHGGTIRAANVALNGLSEEAFLEIETPPLHVYEYRF